MSNSLQERAGVFFIDYEAFRTLAHAHCLNAGFLRFGSVPGPRDEWTALLIEDDKIIHMEHISLDGNLLGFSRLVMWRLMVRKPEEWQRRKYLASLSPDPMQEFYAHLFGFIWDAVSIAHLVYGPEIAAIIAEEINNTLPDKANGYPSNQRPQSRGLS